MDKVGVLALQGAYEEHIAALSALNVKASLVRLPRDLDGLDGLVIPGGESTTMSRLMEEYRLTAPLQQLLRDGLPALGTCAGMILLAKHVSDMNVPTLSAVDVDIKRNAFGRQVDSFESDIDIPAIGPPPFHAVFIRAPYVEHVGEEVEVLARLPNDIVVAARQRKVVALAFHPELTGDLRLHDYFLSIIRGER